MNIVLVRTFLELLNCRNFNRAADRLCVTQSTVTVRIATLERQLDRQLFTRDKLGVELTVAGRKFRPYAERLLQTWQHARHELSLPSDQTAMLSLGIACDLWTGIAAPWLLAVQAHQPDIALNVEIGNSKAILNKLNHGLLDATLIYDAVPSPDMIVQDLMEETMILVSTYPRKVEFWNPDYVLIHWSDQFITDHRAVMPGDVTPPVSFSNATNALDFILARGGSAYFPERMIGDHVTERRMFVVDEAAVMKQRLFFTCSKTVSSNDWFHAAEERLRDTVVANFETESRFLAEFVQLSSERL